MPLSVVNADAMRLEELPVIRLEVSEFLKACKGVAKFKAMPD